MTAQISDGLRYREKEYALCAAKGGPLFAPERYGFHPVGAATNCYRGYVCGYAVADGALVLATLAVSLLPEERARAERGDLTLNGVRADASPPMLRFAEVGLPVAFTGFVRIGADRAPGQYFMGLDPADHYLEAHELYFEGGRLTDERDISAQMAEQRAERERKAEEARNRPPKRSLWRRLFGG
jgi:hypothetical protein